MEQRRRTRGRRARGVAESAGPDMAVEAGRLTCLDPTGTARLDSAVREILATIGMAEAPPFVLGLVTAAGGQVSGERLLIPEALLDAALADLAGPLTLCGQAGADLVLATPQSYTGTGGAAPQVLDLESGQYRPSTTADLAGAARLCDALEHVQFFSRPLVAGDMPDARRLDLATALVSLAGTAKHVMVSASAPAQVTEIAELCYALAGGEAAFRARPFLSMNVNHAVPPLRFHAEACEVLAACVRAGIPVHCNVFGQLGASSPVTMAGSVAQTTAEALSGMVLAWLIDRQARAICGPRPMITDLRTGGMAGGAGEQALANAMATGMARHYGLANSIIAGATDAKTLDAQAGLEKALSVSMAVQSGTHLVTQAAGMQAGLMGASLAAFVLDNEMLGAVRRAAAPVEISPETLALDTIREVVGGEGHFLGAAETHARMSSDFLYPQLLDRRSIPEWEEAGHPDLAARAADEARRILADHHPNHAERAVLERFRTLWDLPDGIV